MARLDDLEFRITASTDSLRTELNRASGAIDKFTTQSESQFTSMHNRFTQIAGKIRSTFALFGVGFGVRAFASWIEDATTLDKLTQSQADKLKGVRSAMVDLNSATDDLAQTVAIKLAPALEKAARFWTQFLDPAESRGAFENTKLAILNGALEQKIEELKKLQSGTSGGMNSEVKLRQDIDRILKEIDAVHGTSTVGASKEQTAAERAKAERDSLGIDMSQFDTKIERMNTFDSAGAIRDAQRGLTPRKDMLLNIYPEDYKRPEGMLSLGPVLEGFNKSAEAFDKLNKQMEEGKKRSKEFADSFAAIGESRGIQAILDGDVSGAIRGLAKDFVELTLRLAVLKPLAEGVAAAFTGGGSFFGSLFGGVKGHASGGHMGAGEAGWVGEFGKELFVPDVSGRIMTHSQSMAMAGGGGVTIEQNFDMRGADSGVLAQFPAMANRLKAETVATVRDLMRRNRL